MEIGKLISVKLTEAELKDAVVKYFQFLNHESIANHLERNACCMDFEDDMFVISVDGEITIDVVLPSLDNK